MNVYPDGHEWLVQVKLDTGEWGTSLVTNDKDKAYDRLHKRKDEAPERKHRLVKLTSVYTLEHPGPPAPEIEHTSENFPPDNESDSK